MSTATVNTAEIGLGTLTWWHRGWLEYALRLETPDGTYEAVEDSWFAALATIARDLPGALPVPTDYARAENAAEHRQQWTTWLASTFG
ncbi:hypothetical protein ACFQV2_30495 [Actinokineospora soli]|uniref:Uncharacterized protein n=1 Tax=Actinokineospora soli TaxID=1048753 RepID=A0ABW2TVT9_9PSEU